LRAERAEDPLFVAKLATCRGYNTNQRKKIQAVFLFVLFFDFYLHNSVLKLIFVITDNPKTVDVDGK